jgi:hypothetical protein
MTTIGSLNLADRFATMMEELCKALSEEARTRRLAGPLLLLIWRRLRRIRLGFAALAARFAAGTLCRAPTRRADAPPRPADAPPRPPPPRDPLPRYVWWLVKLVPGAGGWHTELQNLMEHPEMTALVAAAAPQARRILGPLCRMMGVKLPPCLQVPRRPRVRKDPSPQPWSASQPKPSRGEGEERPSRPSTPREQAEDAVRRSLATGKPIDPRKLSAVAYGYVLHPPRNDSCPPPEIGYARARPLPRDYRDEWKKRN